MRTTTTGVIGGVLLALAFVVFSAIYVVNEREQATVVRFGQIVNIVEDPGINFLSNLPGTPPGEVPVGAPVELMFEQTSTGQWLPEWRVVS